MSAYVFYKSDYLFRRPWPYAFLFFCRDALLVPIFKSLILCIFFFRIYTLKLSLWVSELKHHLWCINKRNYKSSSRKYMWEQRHRQEFRCTCSAVYTCPTELVLMYLHMYLRLHPSLLRNERIPHSPSRYTSRAYSVINMLIVCIRLNHAPLMDGNLVDFYQTSLLLILKNLSKIC